MHQSKLFYQLRRSPSSHLAAAKENHSGGAGLEQSDWTFFSHGVFVVCGSIDVLGGSEHVGLGRDQNSQTRDIPKTQVKKSGLCEQMFLV